MSTYEVIKADPPPFIHGGGRTRDAGLVGAIVRLQPGEAVIVPVLPGRKPRIQASRCSAAVNNLRKQGRISGQFTTRITREPGQEPHIRVYRVS